MSYSVLFSDSSILQILSLVTRLQYEKKIKILDSQNPS